MKLKVEYKNIDELIPYANNAKKHSDSQIKQIAASIREFGFNAPILIDGNNGVIAGHGRLSAAMVLELTQVPCISLDHLSNSQKKAYILTDNRLSELGGGWDFDLLALELDALASDGIQIDITGFDSDALPSNVNLDDFFESSTQGAKEKSLLCPHCGEDVYKNDKKGDSDE